MKGSLGSKTLSVASGVCVITSCLNLAINYDAVCAIVVGNIEGLVDMFAVVNDLFLCTVERFRNKVVGLHGTDREVDMILGNLKGIKGKILWFV